jgi:hypothetical protein
VQTYDQIALRLYDKGWPTLPAHGKKIFIPNWPAAGAVPPTRKRIQQLVKCNFGANVAHVFGPASPLVAIDVDITEPAESRRVCLLAWNICGPTPLVRIGNAPKAALFYRKAPRKPSPGYAEPRGTPVEVFATSGQMVWFGVHPKTRRPYKWAKNSPLNCNLEDVPMLDPRCLARFLNATPNCAAGKGSDNPRRTGGIFAQLRDERANAQNPAHLLEIIDAQLGRMQSSKSTNGNGTRTLTIASVTYCLVKRGLADPEIHDILDKHFQRWPKEAHALHRRAKMAVRSARRKQDRTNAR